MLKNITPLLAVIILITGCASNQDNTYLSPAFDAPNIAYIKQSDVTISSLGKAIIKPILMQPNYSASVIAIDGLRLRGERIKAGQHMATIECELLTLNRTVSCGRKTVSFYAKPYHTYKPQLPPISGWNLQMQLGDYATLVEVK